MPREIVENLNREIGAVLTEPAMRKQFVGSGGNPVITAPEAFGALSASERKKVVEGAEIK